MLDWPEDQTCNLLKSTHVYENSLAVLRVLRLEASEVVLSPLAERSLPSRAGEETD